jgi:ribonuclease D
METITTTEALSAFCQRAAAQSYVTVDTEFLRERTYYAQLCLIQLALPGAEDGEAVLVDPIAGEIDLAPLAVLFRDRSVVKVFHAARQDLEIFYTEAGVLPEPLFDTQVAAMVAGFGDQVGYETLVRRIARASLDKSSRFTDWSRRPLTDAQKTYALADVTHLRLIYEHLDAELERTARRHWVEEELATLADPATYVTEPEEAWRRVRTRQASPKVMAVLRELARFREAYAQARNVPRSRVMKDEALLEVASTQPRSMKDLGRSRLLLRDARKGEIAEGILAAVEAGLAADPADAPEAVDGGRHVQGSALSDLLRVLLKAKCEALGVAPKLVAGSADLDAIAAGERDVPTLRGWR